MFPKLKYQLILQFNVLLWGLTGILGDLILFPGAGEMETASRIVFYRTAVASVFFILVFLVLRRFRMVPLRQMLVYFVVGIIIAAHWYAFFYSIKVSTVEIGVVCMSMMALFTSLIEPLVQKRKVRSSEILLSVLSIGGMIMIFGFESHYAYGIFWGLVCALLATVFTLLNAKLIKSQTALTLTAFEMFGAVGISILVLLMTSGDIKFDPGPENRGYILILGLLCTGIAFLIGVWVIQHLSPFTVSIAVNLEPVYTILMLACMDLFLGNAINSMSAGFYAGASIIISAVIINAVLKARESQKAERKGLE
jgi:drug/metabolite transporter (DMT)-like permease